MQYAKLTGTGITVSKFCIGTMMFGSQMDEQSATECVRYALDNGVNFFDTANSYAGGKSEVILGKALGGARKDILLATKVGIRVGEGVNDSGLSKPHIFREFHKSLERLGTDYVDILYLHVPDPSTPPEETLEALDVLVRSGKVLHVGVSNFASWQVCKLRHAAEKTNRTRPGVSQVVYNLLTRGIEQEHIPFLGAEGMGLVIYNPLAGGLLTDKYAEKQLQQNTRFTNVKNYAQRYWNDENLKVWDDFRKIAEEAELSMMQLAMRWLAGRKCVDSILTGFSGLEQLKANLASLDGPPLDEATVAACDAVWAKIGGNRFAYNR